jgi:hypothetical protein
MSRNLAGQSGMDEVVKMRVALQARRLPRQACQELTRPQ